MTSISTVLRLASALQNEPAIPPANFHVPPASPAILKLLKAPSQAWRDSQALDITPVKVQLESEPKKEPLNKAGSNIVPQVEVDKTLSQKILSYLPGALTLLSSALLFKQVLDRRFRPNPASWGIWFGNDLLWLGSTVASGVKGLWVYPAACSVSAGIFLLSCAKFGKSEPLKPAERWSIGLAAIGMGLFAASKFSGVSSFINPTHLNEASLILSAVVGLVGSFPTFLDLISSRAQPTEATRPSSRREKFSALLPWGFGLSASILQPLLATNHTAATVCSSAIVVLINVLLTGGAVYNVQGSRARL